MKKSSVRNLVFGITIVFASSYGIKIYKDKKALENMKQEVKEKEEPKRIYHKLGSFIKEKGKIKCKSVNEDK